MYSAKSIVNAYFSAKFCRCPFKLLQPEVGFEPQLNSELRRILSFSDDDLHHANVVNGSPHNIVSHNCQLQPQFEQNQLVARSARVDQDTRPLTN
ncbi:hypothetical protein O988_04625 [Pseudogymnoascus sp. VKM F-3808]|nr:hypothetical protein O988_04625 [Pseudogymnoascus sp. VKM F-3808]